MVGGNESDSPQMNQSEETLDFFCPEHSSNLLRKMNGLRLSHKDMELIVGQEIIPVHRLVLQSASPYFAQLLQNNFTDTVRIDYIRPEIMVILIDAMYNEPMAINEANVNEILAGANFLQMQTVVTFCIQFLIKGLTVSNAIAIYKKGQNHNCSELLNDVVKFISNHLDGVSATKDFLSARFEDAENIVRSEFLMFASEEEIYLAAIKWVKYDLEPRREKLFDLISHLKFHLLNKNFLVKVIGKETLVRDDKRCFEKLVEMYEAMILPPENLSEAGGKHPGKRRDPSTADLTRTEFEDVDDGPNVKVFDEKVCLVRIEFRLSTAAAERMRQNMAGNERRLQMNWRVEIHYWCDHFNTWEVLNKSVFQTRLPDASGTSTALLVLNKRVRTKHLKVQIDAPPNTFRISYFFPKA